MLGLSAQTVSFLSSKVPLDQLTKGGPHESRPINTPFVFSLSFLPASEKKSMGTNMCLCARGSGMKLRLLDVYKVIAMSYWGGEGKCLCGFQSRFEPRMNLNMNKRFPRSTYYKNTVHVPWASTVNRMLIRDFWKHTITSHWTTYLTVKWCPIKPCFTSSCTDTLINRDALWLHPGRLLWYRTKARQDWIVSLAY